MNKFLQKKAPQWIAQLLYLITGIAAFGFIILSFSLAEAGLFVGTILAVLACMCLISYFSMTPLWEEHQKATHLVQAVILLLIEKLILALNFLPGLLICLSYIVLTAFCIYSLYQLNNRKISKIGHFVLGRIAALFNLALPERAVPAPKMKPYHAYAALFETNINKVPVGFFSKLKFILWCTLMVKKVSHKKRLKQARRLLILMNSSEFRAHPEKFFSYLRQIDPFVFEETLLLVFKARGCKVIHNKAYTGDGGIDGTVILQDGSRWIIQAKRYSQHINLEHVKDLAALVVEKKRQGGIFIHTGKTGAGVYSQLGDNLLLISGDRLHQFISSALG